jgi:two-component system cell cycle response regulator DivK
MTKILYIEDIEDNITLVEKIMLSRGYEFLSARNAEEGLALAVDSKPDLILLDLGLPDADGQTLSSWLRNDPTMKEIPIIALTAWPEEVARHTVEAYKLNGFLCKPISMSSLIKIVDEALAASA